MTARRVKIPQPSRDKRVGVASVKKSAKMAHARTLAVKKRVAKKK